MVKSFIPLEDIDSVIPIVSSIAIFGAFDEDELYKILRKLKKGVFKKGDIVFQRGDESEYIYIVASGKINLLIVDDDIIIEKKKLTTGDCFGEASLIAIHKHTATAIAIEDSEVIVLSAKCLMELHQENTELFALLMLNIARELARRLKLTDDILLHYLHKKRDG